MERVFSFNLDVNCVCCRVLRRLDPWFLCRRGEEIGEGGGVVGRMMIDDGVISANCGLLW